MNPTLIKLRARHRISRAIRKHHRAAFIAALPRGARVLDVGCGNNSPQLFKSLRPDLYYVGLDVSHYNQDEDSMLGADQYLLVPPDEFPSTIESFGPMFDAIISAHNLEHCDQPDEVVKAMCKSLRPNGLLFMLFPCAASVSFPSRVGTLNFFDDPTHKTPPNLGRVASIITSHGLRPEFIAERYRPTIPSLVGRIMEPLSIRQGKILSGTWAHFGFETVIWARAPIEEFP